MQPVRLSELAAAFGGTTEGAADPLITGAAGIEDAGPGDITFVARKNLLGKLSETRATAVLLGPDLDLKDQELARELSVVRVDDPYAAFARVLARFETPKDRLFPPGVHTTAVIAATAEVDASASIGPYSVVGEGTRVGPGCRLGAHVVVEPDVVLGRDCLVYASVVIGHGSVLGERVIIHAGVSIGTDGFGYLPGPEGLVKIPQIGIVVVEDDVEIGANACIDRATTGRTVIGAGTKIDNQVQIGHNVTVGRSCAFSAQTGISGSCRVGDQVTMGGQVGISDHVDIGSEVKIGGKSGISRNVPDRATMFGYPATDYQEAFRTVAALRKLPDLLKRVVALEAALARSNEEREVK